MEAIAVPLDSLGVNYCTRTMVRSAEVAEPSGAPRTALANPEHTDMGWEVYPEGLYEVLGWSHFNYRFPALYVTGNGAAYSDRIDPDGSVQDPRRVA